MVETAEQCLCRRCAELSALCLRHPSCFRCSEYSLPCCCSLLSFLYSRAALAWNLVPDLDSSQSNQNLPMTIILQCHHCTADGDQSIWSKIDGTLAHIKVLVCSSEVIQRCPDQQQSMYSLMVESQITAPMGSRNEWVTTSNGICHLCE